MDGQMGTCIEWMCNDEQEPGSFDLNNIMSPPDHESMFHSLMNATPLGGEEWQAAGLAATPGGGTSRPLARMPSDPACITPASLVSMVQHLQLTPGEEADTAAGRQTGGSSTDQAAAPSLTQAVSEALGDDTSSTDGDSASRGLGRVTSACQLAGMTGERQDLIRRPSLSCPNTPPRPRRKGNSFFTPSVFDTEIAERPAEICREWHESHPDQTDAAATSAGVSGLPTPASLATAGGMAGAMAAPERKASRSRPRPSRLRELNFLAPTSM